MGQILCAALQLVVLLVLARVVISYFPPGGEFLENVRDLLTKATEWLLGPLRRAIPMVRLGGMGLDLSPIIVIVAVMILSPFVC